MSDRKASRDKKLSKEETRRLEESKLAAMAAKDAQPIKAREILKPPKLNEPSTTSLLGEIEDIVNEVHVGATMPTEYDVEMAEDEDKAFGTPEGTPDVRAREEATGADRSANEGRAAEATHEMETVTVSPTPWSLGRTRTKPKITWVLLKQPKGGRSFNIWLWSTPKTVRATFKTSVKKSTRNS